LVYFDTIFLVTFGLLKEITHYIMIKYYFFFNKDEDKTSEHNQTSEEFVQDEMTKSTPYSNFQYIGENSAKSDENLTNTKEEEISAQKLKLQNTSLDDENLVNDYEIPKVEQFVNLEKS